MTFASPAWFWGMIVLPIFIALAFANERVREENLAKLVAARLQARLASTVSIARRRVRLLFLLLGLAAVIYVNASKTMGQ